MNHDPAQRSVLISDIEARQFMALYHSYQKATKELGDARRALFHATSAASAPLGKIANDGVPVTLETWLSADATAAADGLDVMEEGYARMQRAIHATSSALRELVAFTDRLKAAQS